MTQATTTKTMAMAAALGVTDEEFDNSYIIGTQNSSGIRGDGSIWGIVRGGGIGSDAWVAKLTGASDKFGFEREFLNADRDGLSRSGRSGMITWAAEEDGVYEFRGFAASSRYPASGFFIIKDGKVASLGNRRVGIQKAFRSLESAAV